MPGKVTIGVVGGQAQFVREMGRNSDFARRLMKQNSAVFADKIDMIGEDAVRRAEAYIDAHYERRDPSRSRGGKPLHGSIRYWVNGKPNAKGNATFPFDVMLFSLADAIKVNSLNSGAPPHVIKARHGKKLLIPMNGWNQSYPYRRQDAIKRVGTSKVPRPRRHIPSPAAAMHATKASRIAVLKVNHPGIHASYFMENALEGAVNYVLRKNARIPKR